MEQRTAYIYGRVSKIEQAEKGEGIGRQLDRASSFIQDINFRLERDNQPTYVIASDFIIDKGLSAYYGLNTQENAGLGAFIKAVESNEIYAKSLLVVEAVDRISRLPAKESRKIFEQLADLKIDVAIIKFGLIIRHDENFDLGTDLLLTAAFHLAHLESEQKSQRIRATFDRKRAKEKEGGAKRTSVCPAWMKLSDDKLRFELIPEHVTTLQKIFDWRIKGDGSHVICNRLNAQGISSFTEANKGNYKEWSKRLVEKYLKMIQTYGAFQPTQHVMIDGKRIREPLGDVVENYYPAVVDKDTFIQAQQAFKAGAKTKGRKAQQGANLFAWLCYCPSCGGNMTYFKPNRGRKKVRCRNQLDKNHCSQSSVNYEDMEELLVDKLSGLDYNQLRGESFEQLQKDIDLLQHQIDEEEAALNEIDIQLTNAHASVVSRLMGIVNDRTANLEELKRVQREKQQVKFDYSQHSIEGLQLDKPEDRERYNKFLRQYIDYILCGDKKSGFVKVKLKQIDKIFTFYFDNEHNPYKWAKSDSAEDIISAIYTHGKSINDVKLPIRFSPRSIEFRLLEIDTVVPPDNPNDELSILKYHHSVMRELTVNADKWKEIIDRWNLEDDYDERSYIEDDLRENNY